MKFFDVDAVGDDDLLFVDSRIVDNHVIEFIYEDTTRLCGHEEGAGSFDPRFELELFDQSGKLIDSLKGYEIDP